MGRNIIKLKFTAYNKGTREFETFSLSLISFKFIRICIAITWEIKARLVAVLLANFLIRK